MIAKLGCGDWKPRKGMSSNQNFKSCVNLNIFRLREGSILIISFKMDNLVQEICKNLALCGISKLSLELVTCEKSENLIYVSLFINYAFTILI